MKPEVDPKRREEFQRLMKEMKNYGFRPADVAQKLDISKSAISQYLSGHTPPSRTVLAFMRRIVEETHGEKLLIMKSKTKIITGNGYDPDAPENLIIPVHANETESQFRNALALQRMKQGPGGGRSGGE